MTNIDKPKVPEDKRHPDEIALDIAKRPDPHHEYDDAPAAKPAKKEK